MQLLYIVILVAQVHLLFTKFSVLLNSLNAAFHHHHFFTNNQKQWKCVFFFLHTYLNVWKFCLLFLPLLFAFNTCFFFNYDFTYQTELIVHQLQYHLSYINLHLARLGKVKSLQCLQETQKYSEETGIWLLLSTAVSQLPETLTVIALAFARVTYIKDTESSQVSCKSRTSCMKEIKCKLTFSRCR